MNSHPIFVVFHLTELVKCYRSSPAVFSCNNGACKRVLISGLHLILVVAFLSGALHNCQEIIGKMKDYTMMYKDYDDYEYKKNLIIFKT